VRPIAIASLAVIGCEQGGVRSQSFSLPAAGDGTIFVIVEVGQVAEGRERYGRLGAVTELGGPSLEIEAGDLSIAEFPPGTFNGVRGPELVFMGGPADPRDGMDAVRMPKPTRAFKVDRGALDDSEVELSDLRVPCDPARAATRPSVEVDPSPRCPVAKASVVTCDSIASVWTERRATTPAGQARVSLAQKGCRIEIACIVGTPCVSPFPMWAVLPPHGAAKGEDALLELVSIASPVVRCPRVGGAVPTFDCPDGAIELAR
jgi:hypothetical protein